MINKTIFKRLYKINWMLLLVFFVIVSCQSQDDSQNTVEGDSLSQAYQDQFHIGVALNRFQIQGGNSKADSLTTRHFNSITPENLLKWERVHPEPDEYNFGPADAFVEFGEQNDMFIVGHTLVWHSQAPDWVFEDENGEQVGRDVLLQRMKDHIMAVAGRYKDRIDGWDVVNEAVLDEGGMRKSPWYNIIGEDFVAKAFQYAHEAAPEAELYYNDYNLWKPAKRNAAIKVVKRLQEQNIKVDGIGMQAHLGIDHPPIEMVEESILAFAELGVKVMITELDVDVLPRRGDISADVGGGRGFGDSVPEALNPYQESLPDSVQQKLAERYASLFKLFSKHQDKISRVTFWGLTDGQTWLNNFPIGGRTNYPLLFNREYEGKPALDAVIELTKE